MKADAETNTYRHGLLSDTREARLEYFRGFTAKHPLLHAAYEDLRCAIRDAAPGSILFLYGPTGVGKTTLLEGIKRALNKAVLTELETDRERIPVVSVQLVAPTSGNFDWKDYFKSLLIEMEEPLIDSKLDIEAMWPPQSNLKSSQSGGQPISSEKSSVRAIRFASQQILRRRRPSAVLLDDAQHLGIIGSGRKLLDQLNTIKSLADVSVTTHVLCGTYELIPLRNLNGQLSRRSIDIHFGRYYADNDEHCQMFGNVLNTFQQHLPLPETPDLVSKWDYFYERSIGCVGVLKDWLTRSLALALEDNSNTLTLKCLERRALSVAQCTTMLNEALIGEKQLREREDTLLKLRKTLGLETKTLYEEQTEEQTQASIEDLKDVTTGNTTRRKRPVGRRNPVRDKVGVK